MPITLGDVVHSGTLISEQLGSDEKRTAIHASSISFPDGSTQNSAPDNVVTEAIENALVTASNNTANQIDTIFGVREDDVPKSLNDDILINNDQIVRSEDKLKIPSVTTTSGKFLKSDGNNLVFDDAGGGGSSTLPVPADTQTNELLVADAEAASGYRIGSDVYKLTNDTTFTGDGNEFKMERLISGSKTTNLTMDDGNVVMEYVEIPNRKFCRVKTHAQGLKIQSVQDNQPKATLDVGAAANRWNCHSGALKLTTTNTITLEASSVLINKNNSGNRGVCRTTDINGLEIPSVVNSENRVLGVNALGELQFFSLDQWLPLQNVLDDIEGRLDYIEAQI